jgi:hypothetical protein
VVEEAAGVRVVHGGQQLLERMTVFGSGVESLCDEVRYLVCQLVFGSGVESLCDEVRYLVCQLDCGEIVHVF